MPLWKESARLKRSTAIETYQIPDTKGHDVVYGIAPGVNEEIYLSVSNEFTPGVCANIYAFHTQRKSFRKVIDFQQLTGYDPLAGKLPHSKVHLSLNADSRGRVFALTHFTAPPLGKTGFDAIEAYRGLYEGCHLAAYDPRKDQVTHYGCILPHEGARISTIDEDRGLLYFASYPRNHLCQFNYKERQLRDLGRLGQENAFGLELDASGNVWTSDDLGRIVVYSPKTETIEETDLMIPLKPGRRRQGNYIRRMTRGPDGRFHGVGNKGMRLFTLCPEERSLEDHGCILGSEVLTNYHFPNLPPAKAMACTDPDILYLAFGGDGAYIDQIPVPNLVRYDLETRSTEELGKFIDSNGRPCWIPQCALFSASSNAIYFGMQHAMGPLLLWEVNLSMLGATIPQKGTRLLRQHQDAVDKRPFGLSVEGENPLPIVRSGHVTMRELGWFGEGLVLPPDESAIGALSMVGETLYGLTTGSSSHLFVYHPYRQNRFLENYETHAWDLGRLYEGPVQRAKMINDSHRSRLLIGIETHNQVLLFSYVTGAEAIRYRAAYHSLPHWNPVPWNAHFEILASLDNGEATLDNWVLAAEHNRLFTTDREDHLWEIDLNTTRTHCHRKVSILKESLLSLADGRTIAIDSKGNILEILLGSPQPQTVKVGQIDPGALICTHALDPTGKGIVYGCLNGELLILNHDYEATRRYLPNTWPVRALSIGKDERVYGFYGADEQIGEAFALDPESLQIESIGILQVSSLPRYWMCHRCEAIAAGPRGEVYFGENDRISHLFTYLPEPHK